MIPLCGRAISLFLRKRGVDHRLALGIESDSGNRLPVARVTCPAPRIGRSGIDIQRMASGQDVMVTACVALGWTDVPDSAMPVIVVVQVNNRTPILPSRGWFYTRGIRGMANRFQCWGRW
jgi:hypothetical protein